MRLIYIASARIPTEKAHGLQIMKMCEALAGAGAEIELWTARRESSVKSDPFAYYGLKARFPIRRFFVLDWFWLPRYLGFGLFELTFALGILAAAALRKDETVYYSRDIMSAAMLSLAGKKIYLELHDIPRSLAGLRLVWKRITGMVAISSGIAAALEKKGFSSSKIKVLRDGFDASLFRSLPKEEARRLLELPAMMRIVIYCGSAEPWKGVYTLLGAARTFKGEAEFYFILAGDKKLAEDFKRKAEKIPHVKILMQRPHSEIPMWLAAADVAVIPNLPGKEISRLYTSPLKLFEAMAAGKPIVASRLPSITEILNDNNSFLFEAGDPVSLASTVKEALRDIERASARGNMAMSKSVNYSWAARAGELVNFIREKA
ncbi:MAG: glycosyltransferase [Candidatus Sungbacteria bacterium]|nr:glycosyltransferase [Candidatus Sungbacteria bacterium]